VIDVYEREFKHRYFIVTQYPREDKHNGQPIPMALLRRVDPNCWRMMATKSVLDNMAQSE